MYFIHLCHFYTRTTRKQFIDSLEKGTIVQTTPAQLTASEQSTT